MLVGPRRDDAPAWRPADETLLQQIRLDDLLQCIAGLRQRRRDGLDADRPTVTESRSRQVYNKFFPAVIAIGYVTESGVTKSSRIR